jgi:hypothetical protein
MVVIGAVGAMLGAIELTVTTRPQSAALVAALPTGILTALLGLYMQAQRDLYEVVMFSTVASFAVAIIAGAVFLAGERPHPLAGARAVLSLTIMIACVVHLIRAQRVDPRYPDILAIRFGKSAARELEGVQFILQASARRVRPGETFFLEFTVQNTWDAQRTLSFARFGKPDGSSMPPDLSVTVGPGEVQLLRIPVTVGRAMRGQAILQLDARVAGDGGPVDGPPLTEEPALEAHVEARLIGNPEWAGDRPRHDGNKSRRIRADSDTFLREVSKRSLRARLTTAKRSTKPSASILPMRPSVQAEIWPTGCKADLSPTSCRSGPALHRGSYPASRPRPRAYRLKVSPSPSGTEQGEEPTAASV